MEVFHAFSTELALMHAAALTNTPLHSFNQRVRLFGHVFKIHSLAYYVRFFFAPFTHFSASTIHSSRFFPSVLFECLYFHAFFQFYRANEYREV